MSPYFSCTTFLLSFIVGVNSSSSGSSNWSIRRNFLMVSTLANLARKIATSPRSLSRYENGELLPPPDIQLKLMNLIASSSEKKQEVEEQKKSIGQANTVLLQHTNSMKEILNAVRIMELRFSYGFSDFFYSNDEIGMIKELIDWILEYKIKVDKESQKSNVEYQKYILQSELDLIEKMQELQENYMNTPYDDYKQLPYGIFINDKGSIQTGNDLSPCLLLYIGPLNDEKVKKRGKHGKNILLNIKEFGIDPSMEEWDITSDRIWWSCPDHGHEWYIPLSVAADAECPICTLWDDKKNKKTSLDKINSDSNEQYWWRCYSGEHGFRISPAEFQKLDGRCPICINKTKNITIL